MSERVKTWPQLNWKRKIF